MSTSENIIKYLQEKIPDFKHQIKKGQLLFSCPHKQNHLIKTEEPTVTPINGTNKYQCLLCSSKFSFEDIVRILEPDKKDFDDNKINEYLIDIFKNNPYPILDEYAKKGWSLVACIKDTNKPFENDWRKKEYKDKAGWIRWLNEGLNIALNTEKSGIFAVDIDCKQEVVGEKLELRNKLIALLKNSNTVVANTIHGGQHYLYKWDEDLRKQKTNLYGLQIDTRTEGCICIEPSKREGKQYIFANIQDRIKEIPVELKDLLLDCIKKENEEKKSTNSIEKDFENIEKEPDFTNTLKLKNNNLDGCCNDTFTQLGGALIKRLNPNDTGFVLHLINNNLLEHPMETKVLNATIGSLSKYKKTDSDSQKNNIYNIIKMIGGDINARDIMENLGYARGIVDKYLSDLTKEGKLIKLSRGRYKYRESVDWLNTLKTIDEPLPFKVPYFDELMNFAWNDMLLIASKTGHGKTSLCMNILKQFIEQGVTPYYICSEANSRFKKTGSILNIIEKVDDEYRCKFNFAYHINPTSIELEKNAVTLIDWLQIKDFSETANVFQYLSDELERKTGFLIIFMQLKEDNEYFAPNLINSFPSLSAKFLWDDESGLSGKFETTKIRDSKLGKQRVVIETKYNPETRILDKVTKII